MLTRIWTALLLAGCLVAQKPPITWSDLERPIDDQIRMLRQMPDQERALATRQLALQIRKLPATPNKVRLAGGLASRSTEGDFGRATLQQVASTLAEALREQPQSPSGNQPAMLYVELAQLVRYEHIRVSLKDPWFARALEKLEADDEARATADFSLRDLHGTPWTLKNLRNQVVLLNFWATWCPPCRKEMPDLEALYEQFKDKGLVILAITDEDADKVKPFISEKKTKYPILLDGNRVVHDLFQVEGIPKSFLYGRNGKLVAEAIDMRTRKQFLEMLAQAGLK